MPKTPSRSRESSEACDGHVDEAQLQNRGSVGASIRSHSRSEGQLSQSDKSPNPEHTPEDRVDSELGSSEMECSQEDQIVYMKNEIPDPLVEDELDGNQRGHSEEQQVYLDNDGGESSAGSSSRRQASLEGNVVNDESPGSKRMSLVRRLVRKSTPLRPRWLTTGGRGKAPVAETCAQENEGVNALSVESSTSHDLAAELEVEPTAPSIDDLDDCIGMGFGSIEVVDGVEETEVIVTYPVSRDDEDEFSHQACGNDNDQETETPAVSRETPAPLKRSLRQKLMRAMSPLQGRLPIVEETSVNESLPGTELSEMQSPGGSTKSPRSPKEDSVEDAGKDTSPEPFARSKPGLRKTLMRAISPSRKMEMRSASFGLQEDSTDMEHADEEDASIDFPSPQSDHTRDKEIEARINSTTSKPTAQKKSGLRTRLMRAITPSRKTTRESSSQKQSVEIQHTIQEDPSKDFPSPQCDHTVDQDIDDRVNATPTDEAHVGLGRKLMRAISPSKNGLEQKGETQLRLDETGPPEENEDQKARSTRSQA